MRNMMIVCWPRWRRAVGDEGAILNAGRDTPLTEAEKGRLARAERIIGWNPPGNFVMKAETLADFDANHVAPLRCFGEEAQPLVACLEQGGPSAEPVRVAVEVYGKRDGESEGKGMSFESRRTWAFAPFLLAIAVAVLYAVLRPGEIADRLHDWAGVARETVLPNFEAAHSFLPWIVLLGLIVAPLIERLSGADQLYRDRQRARGTAEAMRREMFQRLLNASPPAGAADPAWLLVLKLEYFRRWQVEVQQAYYGNKARQHQGNVTKAVRAKAGIVILVAILAALLGLSYVVGLDEQGASGWMPLSVGAALSRIAEIERLGVDQMAIVSLLVIALFAASFHYRSLRDNSLRNGARFATMIENFAALGGKHLDDARRAAVRGDEAAVRHYVERVHSLMSIELNDWVRLADLDQGREPGLAGASAAPGPTAP